MIQRGRGQPEPAVCHAGSGGGLIPDVGRCRPLVGTIQMQCRPTVGTHPTAQFCQLRCSSATAVSSWATRSARPGSAASLLPPPLLAYFASAAPSTSPHSRCGGLRAGRWRGHHQQRARCRRSMAWRASSISANRQTSLRDTSSPRVVDRAATAAPAARSAAGSGPARPAGGARSGRRARRSAATAAPAARSAAGSGPARPAGGARSGRRARSAGEPGPVLPAGAARAARLPASTFITGSRAVLVGGRLGRIDRQRVGVRWLPPSPPGSPAGGLQASSRGRRGLDGIGHGGLRKGNGSTAKHSRPEAAFAGKMRRYI